MDYAPLWTFVKRALEVSDNFHLTSADVSDLLGADTVSMNQLEEGAFGILHPDLADGSGYEFREVQNDWSWTLYIWKNDL